MRRILIRRYITVAALTLISLSALQASSGFAQTDPSIDAFWEKLKAAVTAHDVNAIATMSQFPIKMPYGVRAIRTKAQLLKRYRDLFNQQTDATKCFATAKPEPDASSQNKFSVGCKDAAGNETVIYEFVRTRGIWKLKSLDNINE